MANREQIAVIGAGAMGRGIAQIAVAAGYSVRLWDSNRAAVDEAIAFVARMLRRAAEKGRMDEGAAQAAIKRLAAADGLPALAGVDIVIEAIIENLEIKQKLFTDLEAVVGDGCILATNTSSLSVTAIAAACRKPERIAGCHFFNPVPLMKVVEIIAAARTAPATVERLAAVTDAWGHRPVRVSDSPGFLVNHAGRGLSTEGLRIVAEGIAEPRQVDDVMREAAGFRMGPFELFDLTGLDVSYRVMESIYDQFYQEPRFRLTPMARQRFDAGLFGRKTGEGFYRYEDGKKIAPPADPVPDAAGFPVWLGAAPDGLAALIGGLEATIDDGTSPADNSLIVLGGVGQDATSQAVAAGLEAGRVVAVDPLFGLKTRRSLMTTPVTGPEYRDAAHALLASDGAAVTVIGDSPGFIAQRVVATIVNIASEIAQSRIASPADIDAAVRLGLGYPQGPLAMGDAIGPAVIVEILENMQAFYGDPRYRPSPWLRRRAALGVSLTRE